MAIFVTHKLREVMAITDRVTVLRDGRVAARLVTSRTSSQEITEAMTGRNFTPVAANKNTRRGAAMLEVEKLYVSESGKDAVSAASFRVHAGEIVGIAGVAGNGQAELVEAIVGLRPAKSGRIYIDKRDMSVLPLRRRRLAGLSYIPEDRAMTGVALEASATDNLSFGFHRNPPLSSRGILNRAAMRDRARKLIARYGVKTRNEEAPVAKLSGGNLQKVVVARELEHHAGVVIAEQPTRGLDVLATEFVHRAIVSQREESKAVLLVSSELSEIMGLSDRILVMYEGRIVADLPAAQATEARLGLLMAGEITESKAGI